MSLSGPFRVEFRYNGPDGTIQQKTHHLSNWDLKGPHFYIRVPSPCIIDPVHPELSVVALDSTGATIASWSLEMKDKPKGSTRTLKSKDRAISVSVKWPKKGNPEVSSILVESNKAPDLQPLIHAVKQESKHQDDIRELEWIDRAITEHEQALEQVRKRCRDIEGEISLANQKKIKIQNDIDDYTRSIRSE